MAKWIAIAVNLNEDEKNLLFAEEMGMDPEDSWPLLIRFWWHAFEKYPDGNVTSIAGKFTEVASLETSVDNSVRRVAKILRIRTKKAARFFQAMRSAGFIDVTENGVFIHAWERWGGKLHADRSRKTAGKATENSGGVPGKFRTTETGHRQDRTETHYVSANADTFVRNAGSSPASEPPTHRVLVALEATEYLKGRPGLWRGPVAEAWIKAQEAACLPYVDFAVEVSKADAWCASNPPRRPKANFKRFLNGWFARERDEVRAGKKKGNDRNADLLTTKGWEQDA